MYVEDAAIRIAYVPRSNPMFNHFLSTYRFSPTWGGFKAGRTLPIAVGAVSQDGLCGTVFRKRGIAMKYLVLLLVLLVAGCTSHRQGTWEKTVVTKKTWDNRVIIDNAVVETINAAKGTPTRHTGQEFRVTKQSSWTDSNMPKHWR
jgi:hypothetical protein